MTVAKRVAALALMLLLVQSLALAAGSVREYRRAHEHEILREFLEQGFYVTDHDPTDEERQRYPLIARVTPRTGGYNAERTRMDLDVSVAIVAAVQSTSDEAIVRLPTAGGSLPLSLITANLSTVTMTVPIANYDDNQHAENENLRLQNLWDGIETMAAIMAMK
jgi:acetylornithine deacetylase/succinyl-diaminopimelate desuccinylase-like protein